MKAISYTEWLFYHLWKTEPIEATNCNLRVPDTIFHKWSQPHLWYFTSKNGRILKKSKEKMNINCIQETICKNQQSGDQVVGMVFDFDEKVTKKKDDPSPDILSVRYFKNTDSGRYC